MLPILARNCSFGWGSLDLFFFFACVAFFLFYMVAATLALLKKKVGIKTIGFAFLIFGIFSVSNKTKNQNIAKYNDNR